MGLRGGLGGAIWVGMDEICTNLLSIITDLITNDTINTYNATQLLILGTYLPHF